MTANRNSNKLQDRCQLSISNMLRDLHVTMSDNDWNLEWGQIVSRAQPNSGHHQSLEESHIFVLANVLRRPIIVYGVPNARTFVTEKQCRISAFMALATCPYFGVVSCAPLCLGYVIGHFTALVPVGKNHALVRMYIEASLVEFNKQN